MKRKCLRALNCRNSAASLVRRLLQYTNTSWCVIVDLPIDSEHLLDVFYLLITFLTYSTSPGTFEYCRIIAKKKKIQKQETLHFPILKRYDLY